MGFTVWFRGSLDRAGFAQSLGRRNAVLLAANLGLPPTLGPLYFAVPCVESLPSSCVPTTFPFLLTLKLVIFVIFLASLIPMSTRRCRDAGLAVWAVPLLIMILYLGMRFWVVFNAPLPVGPYLQLNDSVTLEVVAGFGYLVFLCFVRPHEQSENLPSDKPAKIALAAFGTIVAFVFVSSRALAAGWVWAQASGAVLTAASFAGTFFDLAPLAFMILCLREWRASGALNSVDRRKWLIVLLGGLVVMGSLVAYTSELGLLLVLKAGWTPDVDLPRHVARYARLTELVSLAVLPLVVGAHFGKLGATAAVDLQTGPTAGPVSSTRKFPLAHRSVIATPHASGFGRRSKLA